MNFEPANPEDSNAQIRDGEWNIFRMIKKSKIPKLTKAIINHEIVECSFHESPKYALNVNNSGNNGLTCKLLITKRGK